MLLEFRTKNYKSFRDEALFSMKAAPKQKGLDYSLYTFRSNGKMYKGLCSSVIYGPNAAGKTNIISAMDTLRAIILRGNIKNDTEKMVANPASSELELVPNNVDKENNPVEFYISFYENNIMFEYKLACDLGCFLNQDYKRKVLSEELLIDGKQIFYRDDKLKVHNLQSIKEYVIKDIIENEEDILSIIKSSLETEDLFLTNGFKLLYSPILVNYIVEWFTNKFMVIFRADSLQLIRKFSDPKKKTIYVEKTVDEAAKLFGINSNALGYVVGDDSSEAKLCSFLKLNNKENGIAISAELFESYGTIRFVNMFPLVIRAIKTGATLVVDEFDASIHPIALMSIINIFHNDEINVNHAQLIFNTHNPIFLNSNLLRRDEIKFVERDDESHDSMLYALSDFGTSGEKGVRKHEDYMKNYFINQYGAIKDIDFTPVFEELLSTDSEV